MMNINRNFRGEGGTENAVRGIAGKVLLTSPPGCGKTTVNRTDVAIIFVTRTNRDHLPEEITAVFQR